MRDAVRAYIKEDQAKYDEKPWSLDRVTTRAIRARLTLLAHERPSIRPEEIKEATRTDQAFFDFARRHEVNLDWLGWGDIRVLLAMAEWARRPGLYAATHDPC